MSLVRTLYDVVSDYLRAYQNGTANKNIEYLIDKMKTQLGFVKNFDVRVNTVQQLIFIDFLGYDTTWADFTVLEVMADENYSSKRISYLAASQLWATNQDVVLMATNRIQRDLTSPKFLQTSAVLSSLPAYLNPALAQQISNDVIALMTSSRIDIKNKAVILFYHICLHHPDSLKQGFQLLRNQLDDSQESVVQCAITVLCELCTHNPNNFIPLIPRLYKFLKESTNYWILLRSIMILRMLCPFEPRLSKKLISPFGDIIETTSSMIVLFEVIKSVVEIPIVNSVLLTQAAQRVVLYLDSKDMNLHWLSFQMLIGIMRLQPRLVSQHRDLITNYLDSPNEEESILCLDLLATLANQKTIDGIVMKMFSHFTKSRSRIFKDRILTKVIEICSKSDYALISDFEWYVKVLVDFVNSGGFSLFDLISSQFLDLALRVPSMRLYIIDNISDFIEKVDNEQLLLATSHIIGEYSEGNQKLESILCDKLTTRGQRVQVSCLSTAFRLFLRGGDENISVNARALILDKLELFKRSKYAEVQDQATMLSSLIAMLDDDDIDDMVGRLATVETGLEEDELRPIEKPSEVDEPVELFKDFEDELANSQNKGSCNDNLIDDLVDKPEKRKRRQKPVARQRSVDITGNRVILNKRSSLNFLSQNVQSSPNLSSQPVTSVLSSALAKGDLASHIAETEIQRLQRLQNQQMQSSSANKSDSAASKKRKKVLLSNSNVKQTAPSQKVSLKRIKKKHESAPINAPPPQKPINGPIEGCRFQSVGENSMIKIDATNFQLKSHNENEEIPSIVITISIENKTITTIEHFTVEVEGNLKLTIDSIEPKQTVYYDFEVTIENIEKPQLLKACFLSLGGGIDAIEGVFRIFPSFFLVKDAELALEEIETKCTAVKSEKIEGCSPKEALQVIVNVIQGNVVVNKDDNKVRNVIAKTLKGDPVLCTISILDKVPFVSVKTCDINLSEVLFLEIKKRL